MNARGFSPDAAVRHPIFRIPRTPFSFRQATLFPLCPCPDRSVATYLCCLPSVCKCAANAANPQKIADFRVDVPIFQNLRFAAFFVPFLHPDYRLDIDRVDDLIRELRRKGWQQGSGLRVARVGTALFSGPYCVGYGVCIISPALPPLPAIRTISCLIVCACRAYVCANVCVCVCVCVCLQRRFWR